MGEWQSKKVLVTGGTGFIGSHVVQALLAEGARVRVLAHYNGGGHLGNLAELAPQERAEVEVVWGDLRDPDSVRRAVQGMERVLHLGALISIPYSYLDPRSYVDVNVTGTLNVLLACRDLGVERLVHTSTSEVYGTPEAVPIAETHPLRGQSPYAASKIGADKLAESFHRSYGLPVVTLRPFNAYGPRQSTRALIPTILTQALWAPEIRLGSLWPRRDYTYVTDTARAFLRAGSAPGVEGMVLNAGYGADVSVQELVEMALRLTGRRVPVVEAAERVRPAASEVARLLCDPTLAERRLGWRPQVTLEEGLRRTLAFIERRFTPDILKQTIV
ncbi:SDR family NAD(P)-dependent oxidoreductase [Symbiobacterium thermophilum]|uniref:NAD-dependent dehydratase n=1 Tax=Symbiobacterium thermophilum TaxID=2734 RepID=A0A953I4D0_SYMTR|nr:SDR family NAD(P)-dependent oxidoreductase [Symbiobacterium thermophilum]MBY6276751.1 NAD-dependent dehydratase [Symbiobacterium thermophilum]